MLAEYEKRLFGGSYSELEQRMRTDAGLSRVLDTLAKHYEDHKLRVRDLARAAGMSSTTLRERFRQIAGIGPRKFVIRYRVMKALSRLAAGRDSVSGISGDVGFTDVSLMNRTFKNLLGSSPARVRGHLAGIPVKE